ncbi:hypothetical protein S40293_01066 [Stachybotrys chartarum IBT 40293]|nr:hypothetical protein S40293_01066 [Stachybotrys chartarum IBT 40293]
MPQAPCMDAHTENRRVGASPLKDSASHSCSSCLGLDLDAVRRAEADDQHDIAINEFEQVVCMTKAVSSVERTKAAGCWKCSLIFDVMVHYQTNGPQCNKYTELILRFPMGDGNLEIVFQDNAEAGITVQLFTSSRTIWNHIRELPSIVAFRSPDRVSSYIKEELEHCLANHQTCAKNINSVLPTRLLDVTLEDQKAVRLVESSSLPFAPYVALSYCWGDSVTTKTTIANIDDMKRGLQVSSLPRAYIDAIRLCRELGVRYLWIDALCIIQDSRDDWEKESAMMSAIYANAHLTIAAASTKTAVRSFLHASPNTQQSSDQHREQEFMRQIQDDQGSVIVKARVIQEVGIHWKWKDDMRQRYPKEPLSRRGWTLQERLLSTRLLSFSLQEMQWTCQESTTCECRSKLNLNKQFGPTPLSRITPGPEAFRFWLKVIENYSNRNHTHESDKLPAISGVADVLQRITGSDYVAGLWLDNITSGLLWRRAAGPMPLASGVAPSFSWASINGEIDYYGFRNGKDPFDKASDVVSFSATTAPAAPLGHTKEGRLVIRGPLLEGVVYSSAGRNDLLVYVGGQGLSLMTDTYVQESLVTTPAGKPVKTVCRNWRAAGQTPTSSGATSISSNHASGHSLSTEALSWPRGIAPRGASSPAQGLLARLQQSDKTTTPNAAGNEGRGKGSIRGGVEQPRTAAYLLWEGWYMVHIAKAKGRHKGGDPVLLGDEEGRFQRAAYIRNGGMQY